MRVRRMTTTDLDEVVRLESRIFPDPWSRANFEYDLNDNNYSIPLVLEKNGQIIGYAIVWRIYEEFHIANIAIRPEFQGMKLGDFFLREILNLQGDCTYAILEVRESNKRAIHLYEKYGFQTIMKRIRYYRNGETALVMQKIFERNQPINPFNKNE